MPWFVILAQWTLTKGIVSTAQNERYSKLFVRGSNFKKKFKCEIVCLITIKTPIRMFLEKTKKYLVVKVTINNQDP